MSLAFGHAAGDWIIDRGQSHHGLHDQADPSPTVTSRADLWTTKPATTIAADPPQPIRLTVDQAACLQSFRPDLPWQGTKSARFRQIGNAVPPLMAAHVVAEATGVSVPELTTPRIEWSAA